MAINFPNGGEMNLNTVPEKKYQSITYNGPLNPTNSANLREKRTISSTGLKKFE